MCIRDRVHALLGEVCDVSGKGCEVIVPALLVQPACQGFRLVVLVHGRELARIGLLQPCPAQVVHGRCAVAAAERVALLHALGCPCGLHAGNALQDFVEGRARPMVKGIVEVA
eukprot:8391134-Alexandrium_andersonii.AAC.1